MEKSKLFLIGGLIVIVAVVIAVAVTGTGGSDPASRPGYGQGQQAGPGVGLASGTGTGAYARALLPRTDSAPLTPQESADVLFMREEEQMAYDLYTRWAGMYTVPVFANIAASEAQHVSEVRLLMERYGLTEREIGNATAGYRNATIQSLYTTLANRGDASLTGAFEAGLAVEERDIADLDHAFAGTTRADILQVWSSLRQGSENHRTAFLRQLGR
jgi:hypothetical protein